jgi:hypothetical protein
LFVLTKSNICFFSSLITDIPRLPKPMIRSTESGAAEINFFGFSNPFPILPETKAPKPGGEDFRKMNARKEIRDALVIKKMRRWVLVARYPSVGKGCPVWRARKNYWSLIRKHRALAERHGLRETDVI